MVSVQLMQDRHHCACSCLIIQAALQSCIFVAADNDATSMLEDQPRMLKIEENKGQVQIYRNSAVIQLTKELCCAVYEAWSCDRGLHLSAGL